MDTSSIGTVSPLLTVMMVTVISIAISGSVLGSSLNLSTAGANHLTIRIPYVFQYSLTGAQVTAAFLPWLTLLAGILIADSVKVPIVHEAVGGWEEAAGGRFGSAQLLAGLVSCPFCVVIGGIRMVVVWVVAVMWFTQNAPPSPEERASRLIDRKLSEDATDDSPPAQSADRAPDVTAPQSAEPGDAFASGSTANTNSPQSAAIATAVNPDPSLAGNEAPAHPAEGDSTTRTSNAG